MSFSLTLATQSTISITSLQFRQRDMDYKVGETCLDCQTQGVMINGWKSSSLLGTSDFPEGLYLKLILLSTPHQ